MLGKAAIVSTKASGKSRIPSAFSLARALGMHKKPKKALNAREEALFQSLLEKGFLFLFRTGGNKVPKLFNI